MKFDELCVLLPCHSLEDFPTHYEGAQAEGLLAAWSALWHPALLASAGRLPTWYRADGPPDALAGRLIVIPQTSEPLLLAGWAARATSEGAHVVRKLDQRDQVVAAALAALDDGPPRIDPDLAADFLALGYAYLAIELLTRQMRYMSNVDEVHLQNEALAAARACVAGDAEATRTHLKNSFDVLIEARERFYPVDAYLVDLTLVAPTTVGAALRDQLGWDLPQNVLLSGDALRHMATAERETVATIRLALDHARVGLVGGDADETALPLAPLEAVLANLRAGARLFAEVTGQPPRVYGRRRFGLSPVLPQILSRLGYHGALHCTLDDGRFPTATQCKIRWEGLDLSAIDALSRLPLDANRVESFLALPRAIGESMDRDHVATIVFAHWPGMVSTFYHDLRRIAAYGPVLGKFITLPDYFAHTASPGELTKWKCDAYRSPYLRQAIARQEPHPVSGIVDEHAHHAIAADTETLCALAEMLQPRVGGCPAAGLPPTSAADELHARQQAAAQRLATALARSAGDGYLLVNPHGFPRRAVVDVPNLARLPAIDGPVLAADEAAGRKIVVAEVPGWGFTWLGAADAPAGRAARKGPKPIAHENVLSNEHMRVEINPSTGGIHSIHDGIQRANRLSAQLALRTPPPRGRPGDLWRDPDDEAEYSIMAADGVEVAHAGTAVGEIHTHGRLLDRQGRRLAGFRQRVQLARGARVLHCDVELEIEQLPQGDPWESYYAARFAWIDEAAELFRTVHLALQATEARRIETPHLVEIRNPRTRTSILAGGLPYHRRCGTRMLDTLLVPPGESRRRFQFAIGVDLPHPVQHALEILNPVAAVPGVARPSGGAASNWLFHLDARNVVATHLAPCKEGEQVVGFRVRLLETEGRGTRVRLRAMRNVASARHVDFAGQTLVELAAAGDAIDCDVAPCEWVEIEARFAT